MKRVIPISILLPTLAVLMTFASNLSAYEPGRAKNNQAHEMVQCAVYFSVVAECVGNTIPDEGLIQKYNQLAVILLVGAGELTSEEVTTARSQLEYNAIMSEMDNRCENLSVQMRDHHDECMTVISDPESRVEYWLNKED
jgi:hypothetical protein